MKIQEDKYLSLVENETARAVLTTYLGDRDEQQDAMGCLVDARQAYFVICDGMGGHADGRKASSTAVDCILNEYEAGKNEENIPALLEDMALLGNRSVLGLQKESDASSNAGTTLVSVLIQNQNLYWLSVGDSRAYLKRGNEFLQVTSDHTYGAYLQYKIQNGEISQEEYNKEMARGEALISYLGLEEFKLMDYSNRPLPLLPRDRIILMSDGVYKYIDENAIVDILSQQQDLQEAAMALQQAVNRYSAQKQLSRDNMTFIIIEIQ